MEWMQQYWPWVMAALVMVYFGRAIERIEYTCEEIRGDLDEVLNRLRDERDVIDREPRNVSGITDDGSGNYRVAFGG